MDTHRENLAMRAWDWMGGEIKWEALPIVVELLGVDDVQRLVTHMIAIRDHYDRVAAANR
jgi:hypothetical protein